MSVSGTLRRGLARVRHWRAYRTAQIGPRSLLLRPARVFNIRGVRETISIGADTTIRGELLTFAHGGRITIGDWCYVGEMSRVWSADHIQIGNRVLISHNVNIHDSDSHPMDPTQRHEQFVAIATKGHQTVVPGIASAPVAIEDDVWIGFNSIILKGVRIGARSVIAAGSTVTRDVPPDSVYITNQVVRTLR